MRGRRMRLRDLVAPEVIARYRGGQVDGVDYPGGETIEEIARAVSVGYGTVHRILVAANVEIRHRGPTPGRRSSTPNAVREAIGDDVVRLYADGEGEPMAAIAAKCGVSESLVHRILTERGARKRRPGAVAGHRVDREQFAAAQAAGRQAQRAAAEVRAARL